MGQFGQYAIDDYVACVIRDEANKAGVPAWIPMGIAGAESGFDPNALGDQASGPTVTVGGVTYPTYHDPASGRYYQSLGLFQLNICGGQGSGYNPPDVLNVRNNTQIAMAHIAAAYNGAIGAGYSWSDLVRQVAIHSGHPGLVDPHDYRVDHIVDETLHLIFNADGSWAQWPPFDAGVCGGAPPPPPPLATWSEGTPPTDRPSAEAAIQAHADRIGQLVDGFLTPTPGPPPPTNAWVEGTVPANAGDADAAISRHADRIGELTDLF
jgi:hypothetical protein